MTKKPTKFKAIVELVGGSISGDSEGLNVIYNSGQTPPTEAKINAKLAKMQAEYDAQKYARARHPLYPAIGDQLDDLYHAGVFSADMTAKLKKVKDDNPK